MEWNEKLRKARKSRGIQEVAEKADLAASTVWNLEQGNGTVISLVKATIVGLGIRPGDLFPE